MKKKDGTEVEIHQKDIKELAICVFNRIDTGIDEEDDPYSWATKQTEEILLERQKRSEIKMPLDALFKVRKQNMVEGESGFSISEKELYREFEARIDYWDYLRIGFLSFQAHEQRIRLKTEECIKKNSTFNEEYQEVERRKDDIMREIRPIEVLLMKIKKENEEIRNKLDELEQGK